ncbi:MAG: O-antigen ligase family protein [Erysipelotrichaceae bacterium]
MLNVRKAYIFILITATIWGSTLQILYIPGIGSVYPLRIILVLYLLAGIISFVKHGRDGELYIYKNSILSKTNAFLTLFFCWIVVLDLFCQKTVNTTSSFVTYSMNLLLICCIANSTKNEEEEKVALKTIILNSLILYGLALFESLNHVWIFRPGALTKWDINAFGLVTPITIFGNTNNFCMFAVLTLPFFFILYKTLILRGLYLGVTLLIVTLTNCRTGYIGIALMFSVIFSIRIIKSKTKRFLLYFLVGCGAVYLFLTDDVFLANERMLLWGNTLFNCFRTKFLGAGTGSAAVLNAQSYLYSVIAATKDHSIIAVHNYFLELLLETGVIGITILGLWFGGVLKKIVLYRDAYNGTFYFIGCLLLCLTSICVSTMTDFFQYWMFLGLIVAYIARKEIYDVNEEREETVNENMFYSS